jgi:cytochrome c1
MDARQSASTSGRRTASIVLATLAAAGVVAGLGGFVFMYSGIYNIAASEPHWGLVRRALVTGRTQSVKFHSRNIEAPPLADPGYVQRGILLYRENCEVCHGGPGVARRQFGRGIYPTPPPLLSTAFRWTDAELYWIIVHGLKMSGMPAFAVGLTERDRWATVAFVRRLQWLSPSEYEAMTEAAKGTTELHQALQWVVQDDQGLTKLKAQGSAERGREALVTYKCASCHIIPGLESEGAIAPPLTNFAERHFIAGRLVNTPEKLVSWLLDPAAIRPGTMMPKSGATEAEAFDMAAYLYTLGNRERLEALSIR